VKQRRYEDLEMKLINLPGVDEIRFVLEYKLKEGVSERKIS
jgi:hypothetical protein